ncbi:MAG: hypothetical protein ACRDIB_20635 [Ardenticatenaceae bacterium]
MERQRVIVRHVSLGSAFKVGVVLSALLFAIFGLILLLFSSALTAMIGTVAQEAGQGLPLPGQMMAGGIVFYIVGIFAYGLLGGIGFAIQALFYNIVAGIVGGLEIDLS